MRRLRIASVFAAACLLCAGCGRRAIGEHEDPASGPRPNIVFVLIDTLRADRLGAYGGPASLTPFMDGLAAEGVLFERVIAPAPWTLPSVASIFSGFYPTVHKANQYSFDDPVDGESRGSVNVLGERFTTLAERLEAAGYDTAAVVANPFMRPKHGLAQGFAAFDDRNVANDTPGNLLNEGALRWLKQRKSSSPFFLYLHYMDVHAPYTADDRFVEPLVKAVADSGERTPLTQQEKRNHPGYFRKSAAPYLHDPRHRGLLGYREYWRARYDAGVRQSDEYLSELQEELAELGLWDETYVIVTADHGEALGQHGVWTHGLTAHQDQLHVPLILRWPGHLPAGERVAASVRLFDVFPTVLEQLGIESDDGSMQAESLLPLIEGRSDEPRAALGEAVKDDPQQQALVLGEWKLLVGAAGDKAQLFNLNEDPRELNDVAAEHPDVAQRLQAMLDELNATNGQLAADVELQQVEATAEQVKRMQALGYAGGDREPDEGEENDAP